MLAGRPEKSFRKGLDNALSSDNLSSRVGRLSDKYSQGPFLPLRRLIHGGMTMPDKWMTVAAAAATINVHPRTIERRIAAGRIESRRTDDGQLQVLINAP